MRECGELYLTPSYEGYLHILQLYFFSNASWRGWCLFLALFLICGTPVAQRKAFFPRCGSAKAAGLVRANSVAQRQGRSSQEASAASSSRAARRLSESGAEGEAEPAEPDEAEQAEQEDEPEIRPGFLPRFQKPTSHPRFDVDDKAAMTYLHDHGYVVISDVLATEEVAHATDLFWDFVENSSEMRRDAMDTWGDDNFPGIVETGIIETNGIGQSDFLWFVRTRPKVLKAFQNIWSVADPAKLIMSFDGCCAYRPTNVDASWRTLGSWYHVDQGKPDKGSGFVCVQGFVCLADQNVSTGGLVLLPGSHHRHGELFEGWSKYDGGWAGLPQDGSPCEWSPLNGNDIIEPMVVHAKAGDLVLWDSRCVHCNVPAWHRFEEEPIDVALSMAGLAGFIQAMLKSNIQSVGNAVYHWHKKLQDMRDSMDPRLVAFLETAADELKQDLQTEASTPPRLQRLCAYVCALPRSRATPDVLRKRRVGAMRGATTGNWPENGDSKTTAPDRPVSDAVLATSPLVLRLIGCEGHDDEEMRAQMVSDLDSHEESNRLAQMLNQLGVEPQEFLRAQRERRRRGRARQAKSKLRRASK